MIAGKGFDSAARALAHFIRDVECDPYAMFFALMTAGIAITDVLQEGGCTREQFLECAGRAYDDARRALMSGVQS